MPLQPFGIGTLADLRAVKDHQIIGPARKNQRADMLRLRENVLAQLSCARVGADFGSLWPCWTAGLLEEWFDL